MGYMSWGCMTKFGFGQLVLPLLPMWLLAWALGLVTIGSVLGLAMVSGWFITMAGAAGVATSFNYLLPSALIRTFALGRTLGRYGDLLVSHNTIFELLRRLRVDFFYAFSRLSVAKRQAIGSSLAQHRLVKDIDTLDEFVLKVLSPWILSVFAVVLLGGMMSYWLTLWLLLPLVAMLLIAVLVAHSALAITLANSEQDRQVFLLNRLPVLPRLLLWGQWQHTATTFLALDTLKERHLAKAESRRLLALVVFQYLQAILVLCVLWLGVKKLHSGADVAYLLALVLGLFALGESVSALPNPLAYGRAVLAKQRLQGLLADTTTKTVLPPLAECRFSLLDVSVKHQNAIVGPANVNATVQLGRPLVIYGVSGGGKSTLLSAMAGHMIPNQGTIAMINGTEQFATYALDWQGQMGFLGQQVDIFNQTLKGNLLLGKSDACDEELWDVLGLVGLDVWAKQQPDGLQTKLGEYGSKVSGGQARRIALARLLLSPKKVLLLDEPFAGLDEDNRARLWKALKTRQKEGLLVVISHHADIINDSNVQRLHIGEPVPH